MNSMQKLAEDTLALVHGPGPMKTMCDLQMAAVKKMREDKINGIDKVFKEQFILPLNNYMGQYREINNRIVERNRRGEEFDKLCHTQEKQAGKGDPRLGGTEARMETAKAGYEELNAELIRDMPILVADSEKFFFPVVSLMIVNQQRFWTAMAAHINWLASNCDLSQARVPPIHEVITGKMESAMTRRYQSNVNPWSAPPGSDPYAAPSGADPFGAPPGQQGLAPPSQFPAQGAAVSPRASGYAPAPAPAGVQPSLPPRPAGTPSLPPRTPQAKAMWDFTGQPGELVFRAGEIINVHTSSGDWWTGEIRGQVGAFPGAYVQMI